MKSSTKRHAKAPNAARGTPGTDIIYGVHATLAALHNPARAIRRVFVTQNALSAVKPALDARGLTGEIVSPRDLDARLGGDAVHQGIVLEADPLGTGNLEDFLDALSPGQHAAVAILDQVTDPHNVGAILRSAAAFSIDALIMQARHSPPPGGALVKAASGGIEHVAMLEAVNLARAIAQLKEAGFFVIGFDSEASAELADALKGAPRTALVFGAEGKGLRRLVSESCDVICALHTTGPIKSLNVSNAAAIAFYEAARSRATLNR
jgi:23S rRNA (guanosine2251-2'-O)-methyltransferase